MRLEALGFRVYGLGLGLKPEGMGHISSVLTESWGARGELQGSCKAGGVNLCIYIYTHSYMYICTHTHTHPCIGCI